MYRPLGERTIKKQRGGKTTIQFNGSTENIELRLRMFILVNQLSLYGAVTDMIKELSYDQ